MLLSLGVDPGSGHGLAFPQHLPREPQRPVERHFQLLGGVLAGLGMLGQEARQGDDEVVAPHRQRPEPPVPPVIRERVEEAAVLDEQRGDERPRGGIPLLVENDARERHARAHPQLEVLRARGDVLAQDRAEGAVRPERVGARLQPFEREASLLIRGGACVGWGFTLSLGHLLHELVEALVTVAPGQLLFALVLAGCRLLGEGFARNGSGGHHHRARHGAPVTSQHRATDEEVSPDGGQGSAEQRTHRRRARGGVLPGARIHPGRTGRRVAPLRTEDVPEHGQERGQHRSDSQPPAHPSLPLSGPKPRSREPAREPTADGASRVNPASPRSWARPVDRHAPLSLSRRGLVGSSPEHAPTGGRCREIPPPSRAAPVPPGATRSRPPREP